VARVGIGIALVVVVGWLFLGRGGEAEAVTDCIRHAGAAVEESPRFAQVFPYAIALRSADGVQSYPELDGARFYMVLYGSDRGLLFVGKGDDEAEASRPPFAPSPCKAGTRSLHTDQGRHCSSGSGRRRSGPRSTTA
jgi:hypothetical protein